MQDWSDLVGEEKQKQYFQDLMNRLGAERAAGKTIYPPADQVFNAFRLTPLHKVKVVIIGQDPYHGPGQAHGLCFSVPEGVKKPPSLRNIFKALKNDFPDYEEPNHGNLEHWAEQGVLLLNAVLTVEEGKAHSHAGWGWERFTDKVIEQIDRHCEGVVFLLWGSYAQKKADFVDANRHHVMKTAHPSPLSAHRGFLTCGHFAATNRLLDEPIDW
ncbi:uracil-DNA glycosylase [Pseudidiomarina sp.]|uniref:uracil-DNA glycosylase n=1 Tax=Pseudidiomarina sp. TaxID=2081707 RepID=UPI00299E1818|nr:uracil-DNA glycosylase [Pseudidiomarina sp.]MDX1705315.1 uracil-DNA glycosylase [Pseudidiomarina sp.]